MRTPTKRKPTTLSPRQRALFWRAHQAACMELGLDDADGREEYRKRVMREECGKCHLADLGRTDDFDRVMARFMRDAGDWQYASKFASGDVYRMAVMIRICCAQIMQLKGLPDGSDAAREYLAGVLEQSRVACGTYTDTGSFWMDVPKDTVRIVFAMLDTHRRRLLKACFADGGRSVRCFLGFDPQTVYKPNADGGCVIELNSGVYDTYNTVNVNVT